MQSEGMTAARQVSPLTVLVQGVLEWTFPPDTFDSLFAQHGGGQYNRELTLRSITGRTEKGLLALGPDITRELAPTLVARGAVHLRRVFGSQPFCLIH